MARKSLNLGALLSEVLANANANFSELYSAVSTIEESLGEDIQKAVVYNTAEDMINKLNAGTDQNGKALSLVVGDEIYILDENTPDFWVCAVNEQSTTGSGTTIIAGKDDSGNDILEYEWETGNDIHGNPITYTFGHYCIRVSKSRDIQLEDYQALSNKITGALTNAQLNEITAKTTSDETYPSTYTMIEYVQRTQNYVDNVEGLLEQYLIPETVDAGKTDTSNTVWKAWKDADGNVIHETYLDTTTAVDTYLSKEDAGNTYLTKEDAGDTYLTKEDATTNYITDVVMPSGTSEVTEEKTYNSLESITDDNGNKRIVLPFTYDQVDDLKEMAVSYGDKGEDGTPTLGKLVSDYTSGVLGKVQNVTYSDGVDTDGAIKEGATDLINEKGVVVLPFTSDTAEKLDNIVGAYDDGSLGKVQGVKINDKEATIDENGIASITLDALKSGYTDLIYSTDSAWTTYSITNSSGIATTYNALRVSGDGSTNLEMLDESGRAVVAQLVRENGYLYYCVDKSPFNCYFRALSGYATGGSDSDITGNTYIVSMPTSAAKRQVTFPEISLSSLSSSASTLTENLYALALDEFDYSGGVKINGIEINSDSDTVIYTETLASLDANYPFTAFTSLSHTARIATYEASPHIYLTTTIKHSNNASSKLASYGSATYDVTISGAYAEVEMTILSKLS